MKTTQNLLIIFFLNIYTFLAAQTSPNMLLHEVYKKMRKADDYTVDAKIKSDIPLIKILPVKAKIYFKQEDKIKVESKSIAILPKQGMSDFSATIKDTTTYTAIITGKEKIGDVITQVVNIIPNENSKDLILAKLWIDGDKKLVLQSQLTTRSSGTMLINYFYKTQEKYGLPDSLVFTVDVKKFKIPKGVAADINKSKEAPKVDEEKQKKGRIFIGLSNYQINQGLKDDIFAKKETK